MFLGKTKAGEFKSKGYGMLYEDDPLCHIGVYRLINSIMLCLENEKKISLKYYCLFYWRQIYFIRLPNIILQQWMEIWLALFYLVSGIKKY